MTRKVVAIDAMSGDLGPTTTVPAAVAFLKEYPPVDLILVGDEAVLRPLMEAHTKGLEHDLKSRIRIHHASEVVEMGELPSQALRYKKDSSMRVAINLVHEEIAQACVSAGNTGALMATARFVLKTLPGIKRPAILAAFPTMKNKLTRMLDLGANVDSSPEMLYQFAVMGSTLVQAVENNPDPTVALLNIGQEDIKGSTTVRAADELIRKQSKINYVGYVEADEIFSGNVDVIVCDGFVGNIALKTCEGCARIISYYGHQAFNQNILTRLAAIPSLPILKNLTRKIDPRRRNGGILLGLRGIVIKSHGGAGVVAFSSALMEAVIEIEKNVPERVSMRIQELILDRPEMDTPPISE